MALGEGLTHDGRYALVANGNSGATVFSVAALERGAGHPVVGPLGAGRRVTRERRDRSDRLGRRPLRFRLARNRGEIAVFDLQRALAHGSASVGLIRLGETPVGMAISPDGSTLHSIKRSAQRPDLGAFPGTIPIAM